MKARDIIKPVVTLAFGLGFGYAIAAEAASKASQADLAQAQKIVQKCLDILNTMVKEHQKVPAGLNCWPGGGISGIVANAGG